MATKTLEVQAPETGKKTTFGAMLKRISTNLRDSIIRQLEAGSDWDVIEKDKMYLKDHPDKTFKEWAEFEYAADLQNPYKTVRELIDYSRIYKAILAAKPDDTDVPTPSSLSQMKPLRSYEPEEAGPIYWQGAAWEYKSRGKVTGDGMDKFRRGAIDITPDEPVRSRAGNGHQETDIESGEPADMDFSSPEAIAEEATPKTLAAQEALARIGALVDEGVLSPDTRNAIQDDKVRVSDSQLEAWNECNDERFKRIARLIFIGALPYNNPGKSGTIGAVELLEEVGEKGEKMGEKSTLLNFVLLSLANGGKGSVTFRGFTVSAEPAAK